MNLTHLDLKQCIFIDSQGQFIKEEKPLAKPQVKELFHHLQFSTKQITAGGFYLLPYDTVFVAKKSFADTDQIFIENIYGITTRLVLDEIYIDHFDRFIGLSADNIPYVIGAEAQNQFFDLLDSFTDEQIVFKSQAYPTPNFYESNQDTSVHQYWSQKFLQEEPPGFELNHHHPYLETAISTLKLPKSRIAVLGCGSGNDAAYLAKQGHIVTGFDFSKEAIHLARQKYHESDNLKFIHKNVFELEKSYNQYFDIVFDHTFYCALSPEKRTQIVNLWHLLLQEQGKLMGIFFSRFKPNGPPFGGSEYELEQQIQKKFKALYWNRILVAPENRMATEFFVYAQKI